MQYTIPAMHSEITVKLVIVVMLWLAIMWAIVCVVCSSTLGHHVMLPLVSIANWLTHIGIMCGYVTQPVEYYWDITVHASLHLYYARLCSLTNLHDYCNNCGNIV